MSWFNLLTNDLLYILASPVATDATNIASDNFDANWEAVTGVTTYFLDVSELEDFSTFVLENENVGNVLTYNVIGLSSETNYYYRVRANDSIYTSDNSNTITSTTAVLEPFDSTNCVLWLDGADTDSYTVDEGLYLTALTDKSPTPATISFPAGKAPQKSGTQNSLDTWYFDGTKKIKTNRVQANSNLSLFMVLKNTGTNDNGSVLTHDLSDGGNAETFKHMIYGQDGAKARCYIGNGTAFDNPIDGATLDFNTYRIQTFIVAGGLAEHRINTTQDDTGVYTKTENITLSIADMGYRPFKGNLCEIVVFDGDIGATRRDEMIVYLNTKWAIY